MSDTAKREKYYIVSYPSKFGMGSDTDIALVSESNLHRIMSEEEIREKLSSSTTYSRCNDLVELPKDYPMVIREEVYRNTIFRVFNQFGFKRDILVGEGIFTRHFLDFRAYDGMYREPPLGIEGGVWMEFTSYELKNVSECHHASGMLGGVDWMIDAEKNKLHRFENRAEGRTAIKHEGTFFDDLFPSDEETVKIAIAEAKADIQTLEKQLTAQATWNDYMSHMYDGHYEKDDFPGYIIYDSYGEDREKDLIRDLVFEYPIAPEAEGCIHYCHKKEDGNRFIAYQDIFREGDDFSCLYASECGWAEDLEELKYMDAVRVLMGVFGYD